MLVIEIEKITGNAADCAMNGRIWLSSASVWATNITFASLQQELWWKFLRLRSRDWWSYGTSILLTTSKDLSTEEAINLVCHRVTT